MGIKKICCELLDLKDAVENLCGSTRTKYLTFYRSRRRPRYGAQVCCALISALLLLLSVSLLYSRLSTTVISSNDAITSRLLSDSSDSLTDFQHADDRIDELDIVEEDSADNRRLVNNDQDDDEEEQGLGRSTPSSNYFYDHVTGAIRRVFNRKSIEDWDDEATGQGFRVGLFAEDGSNGAFATDDLPVDDDIRRKLSEVTSVEDALLLKVNKKGSALREGWGNWFDKKSDFLRKDRMFRSSLEVLNPLNNPLVQDPDGIGVTGFTRGDRLVQKWLLREFERVPFSVKKPSGDSETTHSKTLRQSDIKVGVKGLDKQLEQRSEIRKVERRTLDENGNIGSHKLNLNNENSRNDKKHVSKDYRYSEFEGQIYADGRTWGYYPGLRPHLSFSDFLDEFFRREGCQMRVFMVWNSPPWMFSVRHQRGLESLLLQHPDACVVVLSEAIELNFFKDSFLKDGYKVAVAMPNLEELLKDTPTHIFASVWFEWRKTKFYPTHYSELLRLAALYKYGGIYLDSDVIVLKPLASLNNTVGQEDQIDQHSLNGAVMAFNKHSPFLMECLKEYYLTYDDTRLRWNGADLLRRVAQKKKLVTNNGQKSQRDLEQQLIELKVQPSSIFFPISPQSITRYFTTPATESERAMEDALLKKILEESLTFHFWNSLTSALVPELESLVSKLIDHSCIRCSDVL